MHVCTHIHTHTHIHIYIYIYTVYIYTVYIYVLLYIYLPWSSYARTSNASGASSIYNSLVVVTMFKVLITSTITSHLKISPELLSSANTIAVLRECSFVMAETTMLFEQSLKIFSGFCDVN